MSFQRVHATPVDPAFGFSLVRVSCDIPEFDGAARMAGFACHGVDSAGQSATDRVISTFAGGMMLSDDLGENWRMIRLADDKAAVEAGLAEAELRNAFITETGGILAQVHAPPTFDRADVINPGAVLRFDSDGRFEDHAAPGHSHWHGTRAIDRSGSTIMFAEYPNNKQKYRLPGMDKKLPSDVDMASLPAIDPADYDLREPGVYRSRDDGRSWTRVFFCSWKDIRHFHTIAADPYLPGTWWLSSGDKAAESRVWRSDDDGDTWHDVSTVSPVFDAYPSITESTRSAFRYTDIWIGSDKMIWGADDWLGGMARINDPKVMLGQRAGSRMFVTPKSEQLVPVVAGYVGNPVRSIIDVGPALLATTEAKHLGRPRPQVILMSKANPGLCVELFDVDVFSPRGTGFSFSRASRIAKDGTFFTFRTRFDMTDHPSRTLRWNITFE